MFSTYKNKASIVLENDLVRAEFIPDPGGKMVSLKNVETGFEFLVQRSGSVYKEQPFGGSYVDSECSGFDEMFPTIDECDYPDDPWKGTRLADHGEVWALPWDVLSHDDSSLALSVHGVRFPYRIEKTICLEGDSIAIRYVLMNLSAFDFDYLWAAHLMVNVERGMKLILPDECKRAASVLSNGSSKFGDIHFWPSMTDGNGNLYRADIVRGKDVRAFEKYYFFEKMKEGWCILEYPGSRNRLRIDFSTDHVPYLGILMNEGGWDDLYNIIVEPCSVCFDRLDAARREGQTSTAPKFGEVKWSLSLALR